MALDDVYTRLKRVSAPARRRLKALNPAHKQAQMQAEIDTLYKLLYAMVHDLDQSAAYAVKSTQGAFDFQWQNLKQANYMLSDPWFRENVARILSEEEVQLSPDWFKGKSVLDAGCGNGRWSFGLAQLGVQLTAVDVNESAIRETEAALSDFATPKTFVRTPLEKLTENLPGKKFDLVFCWGVLHHVERFNLVLDQLCELVADDGVLYLYLYGRETLSYEQDIEVFKERLRYHAMSKDERHRYLLRRAGGDAAAIHHQHDIIAPLINRRFEFDEVRDRLLARSFQDVTRTIDSTELHVRALKGPRVVYAPWLLPKKGPPSWFRHHEPGA